MWSIQERNIACEARVGIWTLFDANDGALCWGDHCLEEDDDCGDLTYGTLLATTDLDVAQSGRSDDNVTIMPALRQRGTSRGR